jgi:hypothetical protein
VPETSINDILSNLDADRRYRERRHPQWTENYQLYRDTVITNRLTQRQSVNVPLMKATIRTLVSRAREMPDLAFEDYENNGIRELLVNAYWEKTTEENKYELLDTVDKKNVGMYGRSYTKLNILDGFPRLTIHDAFDVLVDRYASPWDIDTAQRLTHVGIYRTLAQLEMNPLYDKSALAELRKYFSTRAGLIKAGENAQVVQERNQRLENMGASDLSNPIIAGTYVELNEIQQKVWHPDTREEVIHVIVTAEGRKLMEKPLRDILGVNFFTWTSWTDDVEATDWNCDGVGDVVRVPNQILNVYFSQLVENGVLRGYGMNFYDSTAKDGWSPVGYVPSPWGFYPVPGDPNKVLKHVEVPELKGHMEEMKLITQMVEAATAANAIEKGESPEGVQTLGEVQLMVAKADERMKDVPKFARIHAKQLGHKFAGLVSGAAAKGLLKPVTLYKKGASGAYYEKVLDPALLAAPKGYNCVVTQKSEKEADSLKMIQKLKMTAALFPTNVPLQRITKQRTLSWLELTPEEKREVMEFEDQVPMLPGTPPVPGAIPQPGGTTVADYLGAPAAMDA